MDVAWWLTEVHGPRLTNSPQMRAAADWTVKKLAEWGLANVKLEPWGADAEFGRGWSNERTVLHVTKPSPWPVLAYARAWTPGTNGLVTADAVLAPLTTEADFDKFRGKLKGRIVLLQNPRAVAPLFEAPARRLTEQNLEEMESQQVAPPQAGPGGRGGGGGQQFGAKRNAFLLAEGVAAVLEPANGRGDSGSLLVGSGGSRNPKDPPVPPQLAVATEHYNRIARLLERGQPVTLEADIRNTFHDRRSDDVQHHRGDSRHGSRGRGRDARRALRLVACRHRQCRQRVRVGGDARSHAHPQAVGRPSPAHRAHGALDRRRARLDRIADVRAQSLRGSRRHEGQARARRLAGYFNMDNGTGQYRGVYLQGNEAVAPIFRAWMAPFANLGMTHLTIRNTGGTDHLSFNAVGLSGLPVHSGSGPVLEPDPPLEPRPLRPADSRRT